MSVKSSQLLFSPPYYSRQLHLSSPGLLKERPLIPLKPLLEEKPPPAAWANSPLERFIPPRSYYYYRCVYSGVRVLACDEKIEDESHKGIHIP